MDAFELTNSQREFIGLEPIEDHWDRVPLKGDSFRPESILYFDGDVIKRHIVSTQEEYSENQYDELTNERSLLLPKTKKGKPKKLTASVLEQRKPTGVFLSITHGDLMIGNHNSQTTFYSSRWNDFAHYYKDIAEQVSDFIEQSPDSHAKDITQFKNAKRRNVKYKSGDYFCFKLDRKSFGFGRILLDVNGLRKKNLIENDHGLGYIMGPPLIIELFAYKSSTKNVDISTLDEQATMPTDIMMDNLVFYGEFEIIGHRDLKDEEFDFPISYGRCLVQRPNVFLQWGLIHLEVPLTKFDKYVNSEDVFGRNPHGYYAIGYRPLYDTVDIANTINKGSEFDYVTSSNYRAKWDLRNPTNLKIKNEIFKAFGLDVSKSYLENSALTNTPYPTELIKKLNS